MLAMRGLVFTAAVCSVCLSVAASDPAWRQGELTQIGTETGQRYGQVEKSGPIVSTIHIDAGDRVYVAQCSAWFDWSAVPKVSEKHTVSFRVVKDHLFLKDDRGKQFKLRIVTADSKP